MRKLLPWLLLFACAPTGSNEPSPDAGPAAPPVGTLELFASPPVATEGLAFGRDASGEDVLFAGGGDRIFKVRADGSIVEHAQVPAPLGIALLPNGDLVVCGEVAEPPAGGPPGALWRVTSDGTASVLVGPTFQRANYVAVAPDGTLLFSDSADDKVYRVNADGTGLAVVTDAISYPNGIAFSADGTTAYVASWDSRAIHALPFANGTYGPPAEWRGDVETVDGIIALSGGGLVLVSTGMGVVRIDGATDEPTTLAPPEDFAVAANGAFGVGGFGDRWLYVTDLLQARLVRVYVGEAGVTLPR